MIGMSNRNILATSIDRLLIGDQTGASNKRKEVENYIYNYYNIH